MCPDRSVSPESSLGRQRGAGLPMALFLITVLSLIVATMAQLQQGAAQRVGLDILSTRAFYAAESGAQIALARLFPPPDGLGGSAADFSLGFSEGGLSGCQAEVGYRSESADGKVFYTITSAGVCGSGVDTARRVVEVRAR